KDGETGYLIPWLCPEPFAERIELLLENEPLRRNLGEAARDAVGRYRWGNGAGAVLDVYNAPTGRPAAGLAPTRPHSEEASDDQPAALVEHRQRPAPAEAAGLRTVRLDGRAAAPRSRRPEDTDGDHGAPRRHRFRFGRQHREVVQRRLDGLLRPRHQRR